MSGEFYSLIAVAPDANESAIDMAYMKAVAGLEPEDDVRRSISAAADVLLNPERRAEYDREREATAHLGPIVKPPSRSGMPSLLAFEAIGMWINGEHAAPLRFATVFTTSFKNLAMAHHHRSLINLRPSFLSRPYDRPTTITRRLNRPIYGPTRAKHARAKPRARTLARAYAHARARTHTCT